mgnify:CR=1 FL=1
MPEDLRHGGRVGNQDLVVRIEPALIALGLEDADDPEVDALYIRLIEGEYECRTLRLIEEISLNIGPGERLVGIEILDVKEVLGSGQLPNLVVENLPLARI